jgi:hypothetical protein
MTNTILCLGDSITAHLPHSWSYTREIYVPPGYTVNEQGIPWASLAHIREQRGHLVYELTSKDLLILRGRSVTEENMEPSISAALDMLEIAQDLGAYTIFATHHRWGPEATKPLPEHEFEVWQAIRDQAPGDTVYLDDYQYWTQFGWYLWEAPPTPYTEDQVHLSQTGAQLLAKTVDYAVKDDLGL